MVFRSECAWVSWLVCWVVFVFVDVWCGCFGRGLLRSAWCPWNEGSEGLHWTVCIFCDFVGKNVVFLWRCFWLIFGCRVRWCLSLSVAMSCYSLINFVNKSNTKVLLSLIALFYGKLLLSMHITSWFLKVLSWLLLPPGARGLRIRGSIFWPFMILGFFSRGSCRMPKRRLRHRVWDIFV